MSSLELAQKRRRLSLNGTANATTSDEDEESTDFKLAALASLHPDRSQAVLLDYLLAYDGSIDKAATALCGITISESPRKKSATQGYQASLAAFATSQKNTNRATKTGKALTEKGRTLHLYVSYHFVGELSIAEWFSRQKTLRRTRRAPLSTTSYPPRMPMPCCESFSTSSQPSGERSSSYLIALSRVRTPLNST